MLSHSQESSLFFQVLYNQPRVIKDSNLSLQSVQITAWIALPDECFDSYYQMIGSCITDTEIQLITYQLIAR